MSGEEVNRNTHISVGGNNPGQIAAGSKISQHQTSDRENEGPKPAGSSPSRGLAQRNTLKDALDRTFSEDDLRGLCFELNIDFDDLGGDSKAARIIALILHCEKRDRLSELEATVRRLRPNAFD
jgi:hypothetical protein